MKTSVSNFTNSFLPNAKNALIKIAGFLVSNWKSILFALVVAVTIWLAISFQLFPDVLRTIDNVPISAEPSQFMHDSDLELAEEFIETVNVLVEGRRREIAGLTAENFYVYLDFSNVRTPGEHEVPVVIRVRERPGRTEPRFQITNEPETKQVSVIQTAERTLAITPYLMDVRVLPGMTIDEVNIVVYPPTVTISGEKDLIDLVYSARVEVSSDETLLSAADLPGELVLLDSAGQPIENEEGKINVEDRAFTVTIPVFMHRELPLDVEIINFPDNFDRDSLYGRITFEPAELTISSPDASIANHNSWTLGTISLNSITLECLSSGIPIQVTMPEGYENMSGIDVVMLEFNDVEDYDSATFQVPLTSFHTINVPAEYSYSYITRQISVTVVGPSDVIQSMTVADIQGTINLAGTDISPGPRPVGVSFTIAGTDVAAWVVGEHRINIEITRD